MINLYAAIGKENDYLTKDFGFSGITNYKGITILFDGGTNANIEFINESAEIAPGIKLITTSSDNMGYFNKYPQLDQCSNCEAYNAKFKGGK